jgi:hypothetical protein
MNPQFNYLMARQKQSELACRAEQSRLAREARTAVSAQSRRWNLGRLIAPRRLVAPGLAAAARPVSPGAPQECVGCET